eukprot:9493724-Pyramimonas_sp.AAC.2
MSVWSPTFKSALRVIVCLDYCDGRCDISIRPTAEDPSFRLSTEREPQVSYLSRPMTDRATEGALETSEVVSRDAHTTTPMQSSA